MAIVSKEELMLFCREDDDDMGDLLVTFADACEEHLLANGVAPTAKNMSRYRLCEKNWALHHRDHPGEAIPPGLRAQINQLKLEPTAAPAKT